MFNKTLGYTSVFAALVMTLSLKFLHFFKFIKWSPVGWSKKWNLFPAEHIMHYIVNWLLLIVALSILFAILYVLLSFLDKVPPSISALILALLFVHVVEWFINKPESLIQMIRSLSIPFLAISAIVFRFISGTAVYRKEISNENSK